MHARVADASANPLPPASEKPELYCPNPPQPVGRPAPSRLKGRCAQTSASPMQVKRPGVPVHHFTLGSLRPSLRAHASPHDALDNANPLHASLSSTQLFDATPRTADTAPPTLTDSVGASLPSPCQSTRGRLRTYTSQLYTLPLVLWSDAGPLSRQRSDTSDARALHTRATRTCRAALALDPHATLAPDALATNPRSTPLRPP